MRINLKEKTSHRFSIMPVLFAIFDFGPAELMVIGAIAVLLFGKNLPEVGRSVGKHLGELRKGMRGIEDEIRSTTGGLGIPTIPRTRFSSALSTLDSLVQNSSSTPVAARNAVSDLPSDLEEPTAPKFEPPPGRV
jgi:sec-independent protein translocase protein TatA